MSTWKDVGAWLSRNGTEGANLVGSLLTGNLGNAVEAGVKLVSGATYYQTPDQALSTLQNDPQALERLKKMANDNEASIRSHLLEMERIQLQDAQLEQKETQDTIRAGDRAEDIFVRSTRPGMAWLGLLGSIAYVILMPSPNEKVFDGLMMLPYIYMGLRTFDKLSALRAKA
jgi:hypothetical protein